MNAAEQFFYDNAGYSYQPATETREQGRRRCARELALAEARMNAGPYHIEVEPDDEPYDGDVPYDGPMWCVTLYGTRHGLPAALGSLCGVACDEGDDYLRVVAAELADEHIRIQRDVHFQCARVVHIGYEYDDDDEHIR